MVLGVTFGGFAVLTAAQHRAQDLRQVSTVVAAGLMPAVADQRAADVSAQLTNIIDSANVSDIDYIRVMDSSGSTIASAGSEGTYARYQTSEHGGIVAALLGTKLIEQPVIVDGLKVADVSVLFAPESLFESLRGPVIAGWVVLVTAVMVSVPWTAWRFVKDVQEPLESLAEYAAGIAAGRPEPVAETYTFEEVERLHQALIQMADQLSQRDAQIRDSVQELSEAFIALDAAKREVDEMAALKTAFVAIASHEIRAPLSTIRLYAELLESGVITELDAAGLEAVTAISSASTRLSSITSDLLDSALLERGLMPIEFGKRLAW